MTTLTPGYWSQFWSLTGAVRVRIPYAQIASYTGRMTSTPAVFSWSRTPDQSVWRLRRLVERPQTTPAAAWPAGAVNVLRAIIPARTPLGGTSLFAPPAIPLIRPHGAARTPRRAVAPSARIVE